MILAQVVVIVTPPMQERYIEQSRTQSNYVALYDPSDPTSVKAHNHFLKLVSTSGLELQSLAVSRATNLIQLLDSSTADVYMYFFHGSSEGLNINGEEVDWSELAMHIEGANVGSHFFASCYSSILEGVTHKNVRGFEGTVDYMIGSATVAIFLKRILSNPEQVEALNEKITHEIKSATNEYTQRLLNPIEPLEALSFRNHLCDLISAATTTYTLYNIIQEIIEAWGDMADGGSKIEFLLQILKILGINFDGEDRPQGLYDYTWEMEFQDALSHGKVAMGLWVGVVEHAYYENDLPFDIYARTIQVQFWVEASVYRTFFTPTAPPIPIEFEYNTQGHLYIEFLLDYLASNATNPDAIIDSSYNGLLFRSTEGSPTSGTEQLLGYAAVPGPYGERIIEAWFGCPALGIPLPLRIYGDQHAGVSGSVTLSLDRIHSTIPKLELPLKIGADLWGIYTLADSGVRFTATFSPWAKFGIDTTVNTTIVKIDVNAWVKVSIPMETSLVWDDVGMWFDYLYIFYPVMEVQVNAAFEWIPELSFLDGNLTLLDLTGPNALFFGSDTFVNEDRSTIANPAFYFDGTDATALQIPLNNVIDLSFLASTISQSIVGGTVSKVDGSVMDRTAPGIEFITANDAGDDVSWAQPNQDYESYGNGPVINFITSILDPLGEAIDGLINPGEYNDVNSINCSVVYQNPIALSGDNATLDLYTFDPHEGLNVDSEVTSVLVGIDHDPTFYSYNSTEENYEIQLDYYYDNHLTGEVAYRVFTAGKSNAVYFQLQLSYRLALGSWIAFYDSSDHLVGTLRGSSGWNKSISIQSPSAIGSILKMSVYVGETIDGVPIPDECFVRVESGECYYGNFWDSKDSDSSVTGFIEKDQENEYPDGYGLGPFIPDHGHIARWTVHMDLMQRMTQGALEPGWHKFYAIARDSSGLLGTTIKWFYLTCPEDTYAPDLIDVSPALHTGTEDYHKGINTDTTLTWTLTEATSVITYDFEYTPFQRTYDLSSGFDADYGSNIRISRTYSHILNTHGSGISTRYTYKFPSGSGYTMPPDSNAAITLDFKPLSTDWRIKVRVVLDDGLDTAYTISYEPQYSGISIQDNVVTVGASFIFSNQWNTAHLNPKRILRMFIPAVDIAEIPYLVFRGDVMVDNIKVDNVLLEDFEDGDTANWIMGDVVPPDAYMVNEVDWTKPHLLNEMQLSHVSSSGNDYTYELPIAVSEYLSGQLECELIFEIRARDFGGNIQSTTYWLLLYVDLLTEFSFVEPDTSQYAIPVDSYLPIEVSASDGNGLENIDFRIIGYTSYSDMQYDGGTGHYLASWDTTNLDDGLYTIQVITMDKFGNENSYLLNVHIYHPIDATIMFLQPGVGAIVSGNSVTVKVSAIDENILVLCQYSIDLVNYVDMTIEYGPDGIVWYRASWDTTGLTDGSYDITIRTTDHYGDHTYKTRSVYINNPVDAILTWYSPQDHEVVSGSVLIKVTASDANYLTQVRYRIDDGSFETMALDNGYYVADWNSDTAENDVFHDIFIETTDFCGGVTLFCRTVKVHRDVEATILIRTPSAGVDVSGNVLIKVEADDENGLTAVQYSIDGTNYVYMDMQYGPDGVVQYVKYWDTTVKTDGWYTITIRTTDSWGEHSYRTRDVYATNPKPAILTWYTPSSGQVVSGTIQIKVTASDPNVLSTVRYSIDGVGSYSMTLSGGYYIANWNTDSATNDQNHEIRITTTDIKGGTNTFSRTVHVHRSYSASLTWSNPTSGATITRTITISVSASDPNGLDQVKWKVDGGALSSMSYSNGYYIATWNTLTSYDNHCGLHSLAVRTIDDYGEWNEFSITITIDNIHDVGSVSILSPTAGSTVRGPIVAIRASASDPDGISQVQWKVDSSGWTTMNLVSGSYWGNWDITGYSVGWHVIYVRLTDEFGDTVTASISVKIGTSRI